MKWFLTVLKKYAVFEGRARRKEYWMFRLFVFIFAIAAILITSALHFRLLYFVYILSMLVPSIAVAVRRMHDVNKSGWFILIPIYNLILACTEGTTGPNPYGPDPKRPEFEEFLNEEGAVQPL